MQNIASPSVDLTTTLGANIKLYSASRLKAKTETTAVHVFEAFYEDGVAFFSHSEEQLQSMIVSPNSFSNTCKAFGIKISVNETVIVSKGIQEAKIFINDEVLETVESIA